MASTVVGNMSLEYYIADSAFCRVLLGPRDWIQGIPATLTANGFCNAQKHQYYEAPHMAVFWNDA